ncbi:FKBP-type peptidyl-prolyl cis-trans isomerase [Marivirga aurantiaca]|nr:FKBP-type peptidyl-prolyl cis-trans isomerase [Marivirga aurantiaca]
MKNLTAILLISFTFLIACDSNKKETTSDGVEYVVINSDNGEDFEQGDYVTYSLKMIDSKDSVLIDSEEVGEMPLQIDSATLGRRGQLFSVLKEMHVGDSVKTILTANEIFMKGFRQPLSEDMEKDERITVYAKAIQKYDSAGFVMWQEQKREEMMTKMEKEAEAQKTIDDELIQEYIAENNLNAQQTESGLYYVIEEKGSGESPDQGDTVKVNYVGKLMDGTVFDTSIEETAKENELYNEQRPYEPLEFPIGQGRVIPGWDEGIALLNEGAKATFLIPSGLAYGSRQAGAAIPPNSILIFEVELVDVVE